MSRQSDIKTCRYVNCKHPGKIIDISTDEYTVVGKGMYYHTDCFKQKDEWKDEKTKQDLQYIKTQWGLHISKTVVYSQLFKCLNDLLARGISSDYLVFVLDYVIKHKLKLHYPQGFKYFVDREDIREAYEEQRFKRGGVNIQSDFTAVDSTDAPVFSVKSKPRGFKGILGGDNQ